MPADEPGGTALVASGERPDRLRAALRFERNGWVSLGRWLRRRPDIAPDERPFAYRGPVLAPMWVMLFLSVLEVVALDLLIPWSPAWTWLRVTVFVIGVWGVLVVLGILAGVTMHPHAVGPTALRLRGGAGVEAVIPWERVAAVRVETRTHDGRSVRVTDGLLVLAVGKQTTLRLTLTAPVELAGLRHPVSEVAFHADDPRVMATEIRRLADHGRRS